MDRVALGRILMNGGGLLLVSTAFVNWGEVAGLDAGMLAIGGTAAMVIGYALGRNEL